MSHPLIKRLATLSPKQRVLLERKLRAQGIEIERFQILARTEDRDHYPLSFAQQRLWFLFNLDPTSSVYHIATPKRLQGAVDPALLWRSVNAVVARHEALRTVFGTADDLPVQRVLPRLTLSLPVIDLSALDPETARGAGVRLTTVHIQRPFDLTTGPLLSVALLRYGSEDQSVLMSMHHIVSDGWSLGILYRELMGSYAALAQGVASPLPPLPIQYPDFAVWQREWLEKKALDEQLEHWKEELAGLPPVTELPLDRTRPTLQTYVGHAALIHWPRTLLQRLRHLAREEKTTLFVVLLAAWGGLLHRWLGITDVVVGSPIAGRNREELEGLIGFFVNTLVLRQDFTGGPTFLQAIRQAHAVNIDANANQDLPFERLVDELQPKRSMGHNPLFQVSFSFQTDPGSETVGEAARAEPNGGEGQGEVLAVSGQEGENPVTMFDLSLIIDELPGQLSGRAVYNVDLFDRTTMLRLVRRFVRFLEEATKTPEVALAALDLLGPAQRQQLLVEWNDQPRAEQAEDCAAASLHGCFSAVARRIPDAIAVAYKDDWLSYAELDARTDRLAARLRELGVGAEQPVAMALRRSPSLVEAILAILKAGGVYLPLDPAYPKERLAFSVADSGAGVLLSEQPFIDELNPTELFGDGVTVIELKLDALEAENSARAGFETAVAEEASLAYIIYTSGSTGKPKGVQVTHRNVLRLFATTDRTFNFAAEDVWTLFHSYAFDFSVWEMWGALLFGGRLEVVPYGVSRAPDEFRQLLSQRRVTVLNQTPSAFRQLIQADLNDDSPLALRWVVFGGEALEFETLRPWYDRHAEDQPRLVNMYGITETTVHVTERLLSSCDLDSADGSVIGVPITDLRVHVVGPDLRPVPLGASGEMLVGGPGLARGYQGRPALTAERFVPDHFGEEPGERLYRSGDLARYTATGQLSYLGRIDNQVKVRGFRIELGEIEAALLIVPEVREAVVLARQDQPGMRRLVAYLVLDENAATEPIRRIRERISTSLPDYMVPARFVVMEELPLTPNGKIDRRSLPAPTTDRSVVDDSYLAPRNPVESVLVEIWQRILGVERVGVRDAFFQLGGDSILALQMISRAAREGVKLRPRQVFQYQTVAELAAVAGTVEAVAIDQGPVTGEIALTPIQLWFLNERPVSPHHFNQAVLLAVPADLRGEVLAKALHRLTDHHDMLRLRVEEVASSSVGWRQWIAKPGEMGKMLTVLDATHWSGGDFVQSWPDLADRLQESLDLAQGPLLRALYVDLGESQPGRLLLVAHHLTVDGVSWRVIVEDLEQIYQWLATGQSLDLAPKTTSYKVWSERLAAAAEGDEFASDLEYWRGDHWESVKPLPRETALEEMGGATTEGSSRRASVLLSSERTAQLLREVPKAYRTRINDVLMAALARGVEDWRGPGALAVDLESHGRDPLFDEVDLSRTVGWFTTIAPVLVDLDGCGDAASTLKAVKEQLRAGPESNVGFGVARFLGGEGDREGLAANLTAEISFNYLGQVDAGSGSSDPSAETLSEPAEATRPQSGKERKPAPLRGFALAPEATGSWVDPRQERRHRLDFSGQVRGGRLSIEMAFSAAQYQRETIERLVDSIQKALHELIDHCLSPGAGGFTPSDFPLVHLEQRTVDQVVALHPDLEEIMPLTATQQGMLFYGLFDKTSTAYTNQNGRRFHGDFNVKAFTRAWHEVVNHHQILRASFLWEEVPEPLQVIHSEVTIPWQMLDWRDVPAEEQGDRLDRFCAADRLLGFDLKRAPVMRLTLIRLAESSWFFNWSYHHILLDGWSIPLLRNEVGERYAAHCLGIDPEIPPSRPFDGFMRWLVARDRKEEEAYWCAHLAGFDEPISLGKEPATHRPKKEAERFASFDQLLFRDTTDRLRSFGGEYGVTLNTLTQAAWAIALARLSGQDDVVFGTTVSGRSLALEGIEEILGPFINTLASRARVDRGQPVIEWTQEFQGDQVEARQFEHTPVNEVHRWSEVPVTRLLFESLVIFENYPEEHSFGEKEPSAVDLALERTREEDIAAAEAQVAAEARAVAEEASISTMPVSAAGAAEPGVSVPVASGTAVSSSDARFVERTSYPLTVTVVPKGRLVFSIGYDLRLFDSSSGFRLIATLRRVLEAIAEEPTLRIGDIAILDAAQRAEVLWEGNRTQVAFDEDSLVTDLIAQQVQERPDAVALEQEGTLLSYGELGRRVTTLAARLRARGVGPEVRVALRSERCPAAIVAILATLEAGGAYVPIDPRAPADRLRFILRDSGATVLLIDSELAPDLPTLPDAVQVHLLGGTAPTPNANLSATLNRLHSGEALAYLIYTSGSSGAPKAVMIDHRSLAHFAVTTAVEAGVGAGARVLQFASLSFDTSIEEIFPCLCSGGRLVLRNEEMLRFDRLIAGCERHRIQLLDLPTAYWHELTAEMARGELRLPPSVRLVIIGGEKALVPALEQWRRLVAPEVFLVNTYGPTETTVVATQVPLGPPLVGPNGARLEISIGSARPNTRAYVLDPFLEPLPISVPGELCIAGEGVARGYLGQPGLTAQRFLPDPFSHHLEGVEPGGRLYTTGDRVRFRTPGMIEFLGRIDKQVKVRGFRIELGEIESAFVAMPGVLEAAVVPIEKEGESLRLAAYLSRVAGRDPVLESTAPLSATDWKRALGDTLPAYMIPQWVIEMDSLPKTASGKIDRSSLPEPLDEGDSGSAVAPRNPTEAALVEIWKELFEREKIGVEAGFFDLGGDSLLALRMMSRVRNELGRDLPLSLLFEKGTIAELALFLSGEASDRGGNLTLPLVSIQSAGERRPFFCVHPAGGNVLCYQALSRELGQDRPFYGLQAPGLDQERDPIFGVERLAKHYVEAVRHAQPRGPYMVGGWSTGGVVAFEMARQLHADSGGEPLLVLFDTLAASEFPQRDDAELMLSFAGSMEVHFGPRSAVSAQQFIAMSLSQQISFIASCRRAAQTLAADASDDGVAASLAVFSANLRSIERYSADRFEGRAVCFRAAERGGNHDTAAPWRDLCAQVAIEEVPGDHESMMFPPHVAALGTRLRENIREWEGQTEPETI